MSSFHTLCKNSRYNLLTFYSLELNNRLFELELKLNCRITCLLRLVGSDNLIFIEWKRPFLSLILCYALHVWVCVHYCYCAMFELKPALMLKLGFHYNIDHVLFVWSSIVLLCSIVMISLRNYLHIFFLYLYLRIIMYHCRIHCHHWHLVYKDHKIHLLGPILRFQRLTTKVLDRR